MLRLLSYSEAAGLLDDIGEICDVAHVRLWSYRNKFEFSRTFGQQQYVILRQYFYCTDTVGRGVSGGRSCLVLYVRCFDCMCAFFLSFILNCPRPIKNGVITLTKSSFWSTLPATSRRKYVFDIRARNHPVTCSSKLKHTTTK